MYACVCVHLSTCVHLSMCFSCSEKNDCLWKEKERSIPSCLYAESLVSISQAFRLNNLSKDLFISGQFNEEKDCMYVYPSNKKSIVPLF